MEQIRAIRELETWTAGNVLGGLVLLAIVVIGLVVLIRRFLRD